MWWLLGCRGPEVVGVTGLSGEGRLPLRVEALRAGGAVRVVAQGPGPLVIDGPGDHRELEVPDGGLDTEVVGMVAGGVYTLSAGGAEVTHEVGVPDPSLCPTFDVLAHDPARVGAGWLLVPHDLRVSGGSCAVVLDEELRPRWWWALRDESLQDVVFGPDGRVWGRTVSGDVVVTTAGGTPLVRYASHPGPDDVQLPIHTSHHELLPQPDGSFWTFGRRVRQFEVPVAYGSLESEVSDVDDTIVQHVAADGTLLRELDPLDDLQPGRCGWDGIMPNHGGVDFLHANALVPLPDGRVLVSIRNQDLHVMYGPDGEVSWRFGDPAGWDPPWVDEFLTPVGTPSWPYHSHGTDYDPVTGELTVFDNRPDGGSPYTPVPGPTTARIATWRIDEGAKTVTFTGEHDATSTGPMSSPIMGDVDGFLGGPTPVLGVWAWVPDEGEGPVEELGWGELVARIVELDGEDVVLDLRARVDGREWPFGGYVFRAERIAPLVAD